MNAFITGFANELTKLATVIAGEQTHVKTAYIKAGDTYESVVKPRTISSFGSVVDNPKNTYRPSPPGPVAFAPPPPPPPPVSNAGIKQRKSGGGLTRAQIEGRKAETADSKKNHEALANRKLDRSILPIDRHPGRYPLALMPGKEAPTTPSGPVLGLISTRRVHGRGGDWTTYTPPRSSNPARFAPSEEYTGRNVNGSVLGYNLGSAKPKDIAFDPPAVFKYPSRQYRMGPIP